MQCLAELGDGRLVSASWDKELRVWDVASGNCQAVLKGHSRGVYAVAALPGGAVASGSGSGDNSIIVWDVDAHRRAATLDGHSDNVNALVVLHDGHLASGSDDKSIRICESHAEGMLTNECVADTSRAGRGRGEGCMCRNLDGSQQERHRHVRPSRRATGLWLA